MIRELITFDQANRTCSVYDHQQCCNWHGVKVDIVNGTVGLPGSASDVDIWVLHKDRQLSDAQSLQDRVQRL